jgi:hypothetical protein
MFGGQDDPDTVQVYQGADPLEALMQNLQDNATTETQAIVVLGVKGLAVVKELRDAEREDERKQDEADRAELRQQKEAERKERTEHAERARVDRDATRKHELELWQTRDFPLIKLGSGLLVILLVAGLVLIGLGHEAIGASIFSSSVTAVVAAAFFMLKGAKSASDLMAPSLEKAPLPSPEENGQREAGRSKR